MVVVVIVADADVVVIAFVVVAAVVGCRVLSAVVKCRRLCAEGVMCRGMCGSVPGWSGCDMCGRLVV